MTVKVIGLDIAKNVFQVHGVNKEGEVVLRRRLRRSEVLRLFTEIKAAIAGIEACHTAHYWARELVALGHDRGADHDFRTIAREQLGTS
jgi:transposase